MKRRKTNLILCSLILIAALLAEMYCFLEFRGDILTILGTGIIVLVAAFMTLDSFLSIFGEDGSSAKSDEFKEMQKRLAELEKIQKASFVLLKKNAAKEQQSVIRIASQMEQQREVMVKTGKLIAKYDRENSLRLEELLRKIVERPDFDDTGLLLSIGTVNQSLEKLAVDFEKLKESFEHISIASPNMTLAEEPIMQTDSLVEEVEQEVAAEQEIEESVSIAEESVSESIPEPAPAIDTSDPNKMMSPDDIAALLASMGGEEAPAEEPAPEPIPEPVPAPEIDMSDPNKMMSPDDIAALLASMGGEEAPAEEPISEPAPVPEIDTSDPNKMMSPDDIAALFASMGGEEAPAEEPAPEPIPEPAPAPAIDMSDPNKMMSPDDIAALLASMGQ